MKYSSINWNFDNSYARLPEIFYTKMLPTKVREPKIFIINKRLAKDLGLEINKSTNSELAEVFSGNIVPKGAGPLSQAYAGHQFGYFTVLGDGRANLIGEHITSKKNRVDIHLKGSGLTPYSRGADGRAALGPMLREYIISEAMNGLRIPTTRSLAVVTTGEHVYRNKPLKGAILTRVASSHLRIGTFEYIASLNKNDHLKLLADYAINRHFPKTKHSKQPYLHFFQEVMQRQINLIIEWLRVGFIHGVMNTDNTSIAGETMDYGPCAFMDHYDPNTVFSSIDRYGRYSYSNQSHVIKWNLNKLAESMLPLFHDKKECGTDIVKEILGLFDQMFNQSWLSMMKKKLGLLGSHQKDEAMINNLLKWMKENKVDYTNTFGDLLYPKILNNNDIYSKSTEFKIWYKGWQQRLRLNHTSIEDSIKIMKENNPLIIPRNHQVEKVLDQATKNGDISKVQKFVDVLTEPYIENKEFSFLKKMPIPRESVFYTFCGT